MFKTSQYVSCLGHLYNTIQILDEINDYPQSYSTKVLWNMFLHNKIGTQINQINYNSYKSPITIK